MWFVFKINIAKPEQITILLTSPHGVIEERRSNLPHSLTAKMVRVRITVAEYGSDTHAINRPPRGRQETEREPLARHVITFFCEYVLSPTLSGE